MGKLVLEDLLLILGSQEGTRARSSRSEGGAIEGKKIDPALKSYLRKDGGTDLKRSSTVVGIRIA